MKIAPDLDFAQVGVIAATLLKNGIDGGSPPTPRWRATRCAGCRMPTKRAGSPGRPLLEPSNGVIRLLRSALGPASPIVGVGGVFSSAGRAAKIESGANLVQLYSGLIYRGPALA